MTKTIIKDYRFWVLAFFLLRLYAITNPPLEVAHNWRQTTVTMAARNFLETDHDILFPRIDIAGEKTGITGMEFPLLNYIIYFFSLIFGYAHWYGRLINLIVSSVGLIYFYKLVGKYFNPNVAFNTAFVLLFSVWFTYSRKIMPDTFSMSLLLIGFYHGSNYLDRANSIANLLLYFLFAMAGALSKLPSIYLFSILPIFYWKKSIPLRSKIIFIIPTLLIAGTVAFYYFYWVPYLNQTFGFSHFFMGKGLNEGFSEIMTHLNQACEKFYEEALGYIGFVLFLIALPAMFIKRDKLLAAVFGLAFIGFLGIIFKSGFAFYHHSYYIIPFAPVMALLCGYIIAQVKKQKLAALLLAAIALESVLNKNQDFRISSDNLAILNLERDLDVFSNRQDLILINSGNVPTPMYFAHRKGWVSSNADISDPGYISSLKKKGLRYLVILKRSFGHDLSTRPEYELVFESEAYLIYRV